MIRHGFKDLTLSFQSAGMAIDYLGGAMIVNDSHFSLKRIELAYWAHEAFGLSVITSYSIHYTKLYEYSGRTDPRADPPVEKMD